MLKETDLHTKFSRPQDRPCPSSEPLPAGGKDGSLGRDLVLFIGLPADIKDIAVTR